MKDNTLKELCDLIGVDPNKVQLDYSNTEDVNTLLESLETAKNNYDKIKNDNLFGSLASFLFGFGTDIGETFDKAIKTIKAEAKKVEKSKKEKTCPSRPSASVNPDVLKQISNLATEYVKTVLEPHATFTEKQKKSIYECLIEFACWMYAK